jgi:hypothetical protein
LAVQLADVDHVWTDVAGVNGHLDAGAAIGERQGGFVIGEFHGGFPLGFRF